MVNRVIQHGKAEAPSALGSIAEIRTTLIHETGHFFGMSEEDLAAVGLD